MTAQEFMDFFNSAAYDNEVSVDEKRMIFLQCLQGSSDITYELLSQLISGYSAGHDIDFVITKK
jgi:hypothetical protein